MSVLAGKWLAIVNTHREKQREGERDRERYERENNYGSSKGTLKNRYTYRAKTAAISQTAEPQYK